MSDVYMIMSPVHVISSLGGSPNDQENFNAFYTTDAVSAGQALERGRRVFKLNTLTELKEIKVSFEETPMELS